MFGGLWKVAMFGGQWKVVMFGGQWKVAMFGGQWKVTMLGGQWKVPMLGGQWKVPMFGGPWKLRMEGSNVWWFLKGEGETSFSSLLISPLNNFTWTFFFPLILRFYFIMVLDCYFMHFFPFPQPINYNHAYWCTKFSTHSLSKKNLLKNFFPFLEFMASCMTT